VRHEEIPLVRQTLVRHEDSPSETHFSTVPAEGNDEDYTVPPDLACLVGVRFDADSVRGLARRYPGMELELKYHRPVPASLQTAILKALLLDGEDVLYSGLATLGML
jgi:hypothetical protein